jgi:restriction system protein
MSSRTETKSLPWDITAALAVVVAAMVFLPPMRKFLLVPAIGLGLVLAGFIVVALLRRKAPAVSYNFTPPIAAPMPTGTTEFLKKNLADKINQLDWLPFEQLVAGLYATLGYIVKRTGGVQADGSVDLVLTKNKSKTLVRCKHWKVAGVEEKELKEFLDTLTAERFETGIFVTAREITFGARRFAAMNDLLVAGSTDLVRMLEGADWKNNPVLQAALEQSRKFCPRCQKDMVLRNAETGPNPGSRIWVCTSLPKCNYTLTA